MSSSKIFSRKGGGGRTVDLDGVTRVESHCRPICLLEVDLKQEARVELNAQSARDLHTYVYHTSIRSSHHQYFSDE